MPYKIDPKNKKNVIKTNIKESEEFNPEDFGWAKKISSSLELGFDDLKIGDVVKLKGYNPNDWEVVDIYMTASYMTGKPSEKRIKFKRIKGNPYGNSYLELWKSPLNSENYFELVNRNIKESEEFNPKDFGWVEEIIKNDVIDITGRRSSLRSLPERSLLTITGVYEGMIFSEEKAVIIRNEDAYTNSLTTYLVKFDDVIEGDNGTTHCGENEFDNSKCDCIRTKTDYEDDLGKCWWVNLEQMDEVLLNFHEENNQLSESEDDWFSDAISDITSSEAYTYQSEINDLLQGSEYTLQTKTNPDNVIIFKILKDNLTMDAWSEKYFTPKIVHEDLLAQIESTPEEYSGDLETLYKLLIPFFKKYNLEIDDLLNESEEFEEFEWAKKLINEPIEDVIENQYYRTDINGKKIDIFVKKIHRNTVIFNASTYDTPRLSKPVLLRHEMDLNTPLWNAKRLVKDGYWIPIKKEDKMSNENISESEWFEDIVNEPIMLKVEDLEMGDIVIPTCLKEGEYIVNGKGTSVKLLHEPTHWVILKRNTTANTGGVFIEHDTEIGKNCRFKLVHRENMIEESEEDYDWTKEIIESASIFDYNGKEIMIDISDLNEEEINQVIEIIKPYILHFDATNWSWFRNDEGESISWKNDCLKSAVGWYKKTISLHCGIEENDYKPLKGAVCCLSTGYHDEPKEVKDQIINVDIKPFLTPKRLEESEKKPLLNEGRYDAITRRVVRDIMKVLTNNPEGGDYDLPYDLDENEHEYQQLGLGFSLEVQIIRTDEMEDDFYIDASTSDDNEYENIMLMTIFLNDNFSEKNYQKLFYKLQEVVRHEIEHFTQHGTYRIEDRPIYKGNTVNLKTVYGHHKNVIEVPALVRGFYRRAKLERKPLDVIMIEDLKDEVSKGSLTQKQADNLLKIWTDYAKKHLPKATYSKN
jgi:hypothetical protein